MLYLLASLTGLFLLLSLLALYGWLRSRRPAPGGFLPGPVT